MAAKSVPLLVRRRGITCYSSPLLACIALVCMHHSSPFTSSLLPSSSFAMATSAADNSTLMFFPPACRTVAALGARQCCPNACGGPARGACVMIGVSSQQGADPLCDYSASHGLAHTWITDYFDSACQCFSRYAGAACEQCADGYTGDECSQKQSVRVRREWTTLSRAEQSEIIEAFNIAKRTPSPWQPHVSIWDYHTAYHNFAANDTGVNYAHMSSGFPTWHRRYLLSLESAIANATNNPSFAMPYWNWTTHWADRRMDPVFLDFGGDGLPNTPDGCRSDCNCQLVTGPFANWSVVGAWGRADDGWAEPMTRALGCYGSRSSQWSDVQYTLALDAYDSAPYNRSRRMSPEYDTFRVALEGFGFTMSASGETINKTATSMHNLLHNTIGGALAAVPFASNDPLFFLHHTFVDLLIEMWLRRQWTENGDPLQTGRHAPETGAAPGHNLKECLGGFVPLTRHMDHYRQSTGFGYDYDFLQTTTAIPATVFNSTFFFPPECRTAAALSSRSCCPNACGGSERGTCVSVTAPGPDGQDPMCDNTATENGLLWITYHYDTVCSCRGHYHGPACEQCEDGYTGADCSVKKPARVRREWTTLSLKERLIVIDAFNVTKYTPSPWQSTVSLWDWHTAYHSFAAGSGFGAPNYAHVGSGFPTWHRRYLLSLESAIANATNNPEFALPYWNWTTHANSREQDSVWHDFGGDGEWNDPPECRNPNAYKQNNSSYCSCTLKNGTFAGWPTVGAWGVYDPKHPRPMSRALHCYDNGPKPNASTWDEVMAAVALDRYDASPYKMDRNPDAFRTALEGWGVAPATSVDLMHNLLHDTIGGQMQFVPVASNDPLFFLHHAFIDFIFEMWLERQWSKNGDPLQTGRHAPASGAPPGHNLRECLGAFVPLTRHIDYYGKSDVFGYVYEVYRAPPPRPTGSAGVWKVLMGVIVGVTVGSLVAAIGFLIRKRNNGGAAPPTVTSSGVVAVAQIPMGPAIHIAPEPVPAASLNPVPVSVPSSTGSETAGSLGLAIQQ